MVMEALVERDGFALLSMGHTRERGCFCPVNTLLRQAIDLVREPFAATLIDAEAGIEQVNRQVTRRVSRVLAITDGSRRGDDTARAIADLVAPTPCLLVRNRAAPGGGEAQISLAEIGRVPEDEALRNFDRRGQPLWELPGDNRALAAARAIADRLGIASIA